MTHRWMISEKPMSLPPICTLIAVTVASTLSSCGGFTPPDTDRSGRRTLVTGATPQGRSQARLRPVHPGYPWIVSSTVVAGGDQPPEPGDIPLTASPQQQPAGTTPAWVVSRIRQIEQAGALDQVVSPLQSLAENVLASPRLADGLRGAQIGHALHPLLTDFPLGAWMSASFLDLFAGRHARGASQRLIGFGLLVALPTAASGLAEWQVVEARAAKRVGVVHAGVNATATVLYGSSWLARRRGEHRRAVLLGVAGGLVATLGGYFGGHLSLVRKVGTADQAFGPDN